MSGVPFIDGTKIVSLLTRSLLTTETTLRSLDQTESLEFSRHMETLIDTVRGVGITDEKWGEMLNEARTSRGQGLAIDESPERVGEAHRNNRHENLLLLRRPLRAASSMTTSH